MEINTWQDADRALERFAAAEAESDAQLAALDLAFANVRARHQLDRDLTTAELAKLEAALKKFAAAHKAEFKAAPNGDGRSYEHAGAVLGFRQSPGRVEIRKEEETIEWLRDFREGTFVRVVHEANREMLLDILRQGVLAKDKRLVETLAAHGITFRQADKFFLEVKT